MSAGVVKSAVSVRARLLNIARRDGANFNQILVRFALERMLYRLSTSRHADRFLLKGALLFTLWYDMPHRPTRDMDLLGIGPSDLASVKDVFRSPGSPTAHVPRLHGHCREIPCHNNAGDGERSPQGLLRSFRVVPA